MARLVHIVGSPRGERSRSEAVANHLIGKLGGMEVDRLDVWDMDLPELDGAMIESRYRLIHGADVEAGFTPVWDDLRAMVDHLLSFDIWLFSTPMWNFGLPYRLKHFVDCIIQPTMAFTNDAAGNLTFHGTGRTAVLIGAGALDIRPGSGLAHLDYQLAHLEHCLRFYFGIDPIHCVRVAPTFGSPQDVETVMRKAEEEVEALALNLQNAAGRRD
ncbi:FMN-dependent NADH-azoreductase [Sphingomonas daechungensis]|uniref:FMN-dependent NADH-azoreductase n=1 Tax=Sphingomonas daechungensis TaxID=1176646 RepID=UPI0037849FE1